MIRLYDAFSLLEEQVHQSSPLQKLSAAVQFPVSLLVILSALSTDSSDIFHLLPFTLFPVLVMLLGKVPLSLIFRIYLGTLPLFFFFFLSNLIFDSEPWILLERFQIRRGWVTGFSLTIKGAIAVFTLLSFIAIKGMNGVFMTLKKFRLPGLFLSILALTFRYIKVLMEEAARMITAYHLRAPGHKGIYWKDWGALGGQWFIRTLRRSDKIHQAMECRGGNGDYLPESMEEEITWKDFLWGAFWITFCILILWRKR